MLLPLMTELITRLFMKNSNLSNTMLVLVSIRGTFSEKLYYELGLKSLKLRRRFRKLCHFYKILNEKSPSYYENMLFL